ncbi:MAG: hypothetical protein HFH94_04955 [Lachnospiraceae bacterium]|nr:hypothetical protein [uncultured Acetatifactor sp.]MCI9219072.1 hypothetical protein [Lachnospiraceae bacterium]
MTVAKVLCYRYILKVNRGDEAFPLFAGEYLAAEDSLAAGEPLSAGDGIAAPKRRILIRRREKSVFTGIQSVFWCMISSRGRAFLNLWGGLSKGEDARSGNQREENGDGR